MKKILIILIAACFAALTCLNAYAQSTISGDTIISSGDSTVLTSPPSGSCGSYLWSTGDTTASITVSPTITTTYTVFIQARSCGAYIWEYFQTLEVTVTVLSPCTAPNSIVAKYKDDADQLALRKIYRNNLSYKDSIHIPKIHSDIVLNALLAVYNATSLPARDTVVSMFDIHSFPYITMNNFLIVADTNLSWMQQLKKGNLITGNSIIDNLISTYNLTIHNYYDWINGTDMVVFITGSNYNLPILISTIKLDSIPGVSFVEPNSRVVGDGNDICDSIYADHVELIYSFGWGDCPAGCTERRFWKFNVDFNCAVKYIGSYGSLLYPTSIEEHLTSVNYSVFPNPSNDMVEVSLSQLVNGKLTITDMLGREVYQENINSNRVKINVSNLPIGYYNLSIISETKTIHERIMIAR